jgi:hypothetical protein
METNDEKMFIKPIPRPFPMDPLQLFADLKLDAAQKGKIILAFLQYDKNCAREYIKLHDAIIKALDILEG